MDVGNVDKKAKTQDVLARINKVNDFYPESLMETFEDKIIQGRTYNYLAVRNRIQWFYLVYPNGAILPEIKELSANYVIFKTSIYTERNKPESLISQGHAMGIFSDGYNKDLFATTETLSTGRALALAGFGTSACGNDLEDGTFADAPVVNSLNMQDETDLKKQFEEQIVKYYDELDKEKAFAVMITFGPEQGKFIKNICKKQGDKVAALRWYLNLTEIPEIHHARSVAACRRVVEEYDKTIKEKSIKT